jgi:hypothetical protein
MSKLILVVTAMVFVGITAFCAEPPTVYESEGFSLKIAPDGIMHSLKVGNEMLAKSVILHGTYKIISGDNHDARFFQSGKNSPPLVTRADNNVLVYEISGELSNKKYSPGASYSEKITVSPFEIKVEREVETKVELASNDKVFMDIITFFPGPLKNRGMRFISPAGKDETRVIPQEYSEAGKLHISIMKSLKISLESGTLEILSGEKTHLSIMDCRSWKEDAIRVDICESFLWKNPPYIFPAGTKFKWAYTMKYMRYDD